MIQSRYPQPLLALALVGALALAGCGSSATGGSTAKSTPEITSRQAGAGSPPRATPPPAVSELPAAEHPNASQFPPARGRTLRQLAALAGSGAQFGAATGVFVPGDRRLAFGLNTGSGAFVYAPTAIYIAATPGTPARGPFLAPADPLTVAPQYRSTQNAGPGGIQAIYAADVPVPRQGTYTVLALTRTAHGLIGSPGQIAVAAASPIPDVGQRPPAIATDTPASVGGHTSLLSTRVPPEDMHAVSFKDVLGKRPVALLFSTPQLCMSRVCGPVTDIAAELEHQFAGGVTFIHEEIYVNNQPNQGLRPQLKAFHLQTEPWLFTVNRQGRIAARLDGAFGVNAFTQALQAALR
ncbi:MAG: hypothetical protein ACR2OB_13645 [Solirubrobacteraceae bacterium]